MRAWFYSQLGRTSRAVGLWLVRLTASVIAVGYFLFLPRRLACSVQFYRALFPEKRWTYAWYCSWRQYQDFASVYTERLAIEHIGSSDYESEGLGHIEQAHAGGTGAVMVMSHFGRWEIGARLLARDHHELTLIMGGAVDASPDKVVSSDLERDGVDVISVARDRARGTDVLDAVQTVGRGGVVALAGDRAWGTPRMMRLPFLARSVDIPMAPFVLALATGAPLLIVFACRTGRGRYRFTCLPPRLLSAAKRGDRDRVLREAGMGYLEELRKMARAHPEQWHTFGPFFADDTAPSPTE